MFLVPVSTFQPIVSLVLFSQSLVLSHFFDLGFLTACNFFSPDRMDNLVGIPPHFTCVANLTLIFRNARVGLVGLD